MRKATLAPTEARRSNRTSLELKASSVNAAATQPTESGGCHSDATLAETAALYARIGLTMGGTLLLNDGFDEARLQAGLNKFKP